CQARWTPRRGHGRGRDAPHGRTTGPPVSRRYQRGIDDPPRGPGRSPADRGVVAIARPAADKTPVSEARVARDYDRWLTGGSLSGLLYGAMSSLPGTVLVNTPAFHLHTELQIRPDQRVLDIGCGRG